MSDFATAGKSNAVASAYGGKESQTQESGPGKSTLVEQSYPQVAQSPGASNAQEVMFREFIVKGKPPEEIAKFLNTHPQYTSMVIMLVQQIQGNAVSQQILKLVQPTAHKEDPAKSVLDNLAADKVPHDVDLLSITTSLVLLAHAEWTGALSDVYTDIQTESDTELEMLPAVALNFFTGFVSLGVQGAIAYVASKGVQAAAKSLGVKVAEELSDSAESSIEVLVGGTLDQGKDMAKGPLNRGTKNTKGEKGEKGEFLTALNHYMRTFFTNITTRVAPHSNNRQLAELAVAFNKDKWVRDNLKTSIMTRLKEFSGSKTKDIGRREANATLPKGEKSEALEHTERETGVAWLLMGGDKKKLVYVVQDFEIEDATAMKLVPAYQNAPMLSYGDTADDTMGIKHKMKPVGRPAYAGDVEPNLVTIAEEKHKEEWQQDPQTYDVGMILNGASANNVHQTAPEKPE